jgi:hypothetical protein
MFKSWYRKQHLSPTTYAGLWAQFHHLCTRAGAGFQHPRVHSAHKQTGLVCSERKEMDAFSESLQQSVRDFVIQAQRWLKGRTEDSSAFGDAAVLFHTHVQVCVRMLLVCGSSLNSVFFL